MVFLFANTSAISSASFAPLATICKCLVTDIETGDYGLDDDDVTVMKRTAVKHRPDSLQGMRIAWLSQNGPDRRANDECRRMIRGQVNSFHCYSKSYVK